MASALAGLTVSGFVAPIPILTRGLAFLLGPLQSRLVLGSDAENLPYGGTAFAIALLAAVLAMSLLGRRFWCRILCPTGAIFALTTRLALTRRRVTERCIECGECDEACAFGAIRSDRTTLLSECTFCQQCGGVCPTGAVEFTGRFVSPSGARPTSPATAGAGLTRRALIVGAAGSVLGGLAFTRSVENRTGAATAAPSPPPLRPPGSLPEPVFLAACVRCGSCIKGCPSGVLVPAGSDRGIDELWTPQLDPNRAGCAPDCNICGQTCPTGAIRALPMEEKRAVHIGRAEVNETTCLPHAHSGRCRLCMDACHAAGYDAIEFILVGVETDASGMPVDGTGDLAPAIIPERCVGCGLCQTVCHKVNVRQMGLLADSAILVRAGGGRDDRMVRGSYRALRDAGDPHGERTE